MERAVYGGDGLARRANGSVVFVRFTLPGELVQIEAPPDSNDAKLIRVIESSEARVAPGCPHFGPCGGCQYQHASYEAQLAMKQSVLLETMERAGVSELPALQTHAAEPWEYRNRVRFRMERVEGEVRFGYSKRGGNEFLPIEVCPISAALIVDAAEACIDGAKQNVAIGGLLEFAKEVEFFINEDASRLSMTLFLRQGTRLKSGALARFCEGLQASVPELSGASAMLLDKSGTRPTLLDAWGSEGLAYRVADETYWVSRGGFFQVNRFLTATLVDLVCAGRHGALAWDLYAGVGLFSRVLARNFLAVTAVEANPIAVSDLRAALAKLGPEQAAVERSTVAFLRDAVVQRERPELIVLDPPRAGAGAEVCELLLRVAAREMVYVSCDPTTLARDLAVLQRDYEVAAMNLVDLFPQTFHMETVVTLTHR